MAATQQASVWVFTASTPAELVTEVDGELSCRGLVYRVAYGLGERVPPAYNRRTMTAHSPLGAYRADQHGGNEAALLLAKQACQEDFDAQL